ncbi:hypothetical protein [Leuconostoc mesenteroides]|uniref:hypothetical protein n=1 Tax=Leuconostoc mesenteroides TaxID=1245 RepID=UPI0030CF9617
MYNIKNLKTEKWLDESEKEFDNPVGLGFGAAIKIHNNHMNNIEEYECINAKGYGDNKQSIKNISEKRLSDSFLRNFSNAVSYFSNHSVTHASEKATVYVKIR